MPSPEDRLTAAVAVNDGLHAVVQGWRLTTDGRNVTAVSSQRELRFHRDGALWVADHDNATAADLELVAHLAGDARWFEAPAAEPPKPKARSRKPKAVKR